MQQVLLHLNMQYFQLKLLFPFKPNLFSNAEKLAGKIARKREPVVKVRVTFPTGGKRRTSEMTCFATIFLLTG